MAAFIKLYDWINTIPDLSIEEKVVLALVHQFTEKGGKGYYAGYSIAALRTGFPKKRCKQIINHLLEIEAIKADYRKADGATQLFLTSNPAFINDYQDDD